MESTYDLAPKQNVFKLIKADVRLLQMNWKAVQQLRACIHRTLGSEVVLGPPDLMTTSLCVCVCVCVCVYIIVVTRSSAIAGRPCDAKACQ